MPNLNKPKKVYAIRMGDYAELRWSRTPIKAKVSKLAHTIMIKKGDVLNPGDDSWYHEYAEKDTTRKVTMKQTFFIGGTVLGYLSITRLMRLFKVGAPKDSLVQLNEKATKDILDPKWRKANLKWV